MDEVKQTTTAKPVNSKGKKIISIVIVLAILAAGGATAYYLLRSNKKTTTSNDNKSSQVTAPANTKLTEQQVTDTKTRYEQTKRTIANPGNRTNQEMANLYASAAFDGAQLNDAQAKDFAAKALQLIPQADKNKTENKPYQSYLNILTEISKGNYSAAQGVVDTTTAAPQQ